MQNFLYYIVLLHCKTGEYNIYKLDTVSDYQSDQMLLSWFPVQLNSLN